MPSRFGVVQGAKVRAVDDFSEFLVNAACGTGEQIVLQGLDDVASAAKYMLSAPGEDGNIWVPSAEGMSCLQRSNGRWLAKK